MGNSLSDQLLKAGLATKQQAKKVQTQKKKQQKLKKHNNIETVDEAKVLAKEAAEKAADRDRELNRQKQAAAEKKAIAAQVRQLIKLNRIPRNKGELNYNFPVDGKVQQILVTARLQQELADGKIAVARYGEGFELVAANVADKIIQRDTDCIVLQNEKSAATDEDDQYADFEVPDDLMW